MYIFDEHKLVLAEKRLLKHVQVEAVKLDDLKTLYVFADEFELLRIKTKVILKKDGENFKYHHIMELFKPS